MADPFLNVSILTHEDYHGVYFTISSIRMHHPEVMNRIHFTLVDNSPDSKHGNELFNFAKNSGGVIDYHQVRGVSSSTFKNLGFELARAPYVLHLDGHVLLRPRSLARLIKFYETFPDNHDLLQGPLYADNNTIIASHMRPAWRGGNFGTWEIDSRCIDERSEMFEIPMHGMGLFACSRAGWPRFAGGMRAFGAEEGAIQEKFRLLGRKAWCLPFLGWMHRFGRPDGPKYTNTNEDKVRNYIAAFKEVGLPLDSIREHYKHRIWPHDHRKNEQWIDELMLYADRLPKTALTPPSGYKPFLGQEIVQLSDK